MSKEQILTVEPCRENESITLRAENTACAQLWPYEMNENLKLYTQIYEPLEVFKLVKYNYKFVFIYLGISLAFLLIIHIHALL